MHGMHVMLCLPGRFSVRPQEAQASRTGLKWLLEIGCAFGVWHCHIGHWPSFGSQPAVMARRLATLAVAVALATHFGSTFTNWLPSNPVERLGLRFNDGDKDPILGAQPRLTDYDDLPRRFDRERLLDFFSPSAGHSCHSCHSCLYCVLLHPVASCCSRLTRNLSPSIGPCAILCKLRRRNCEALGRGRSRGGGRRSSRSFGPAGTIGTRPEASVRLMASDFPYFSRG